MVFSGKHGHRPVVGDASWLQRAAIMACRGLTVTSDMPWHCLRITDRYGFQPTDVPSNAWYPDLHAIGQCVR